MNLRNPIFSKIGFLNLNSKTLLMRIKSWCDAGCF